jgi:hypothetical protein
MLTILDLTALATVTGAAAAPSADQQAEFRQLAQNYCPATYARYKNAPQITRRMGEKCLDEAGYGGFKSYLDRYFPRQ